MAAPRPSAAREPAHFRIYGDYAGAEPAFYRREDFPWVDDLQRHWHVIRREFEDYAYRRSGALKPNFVPDAVELTGWLGVNLFTYRRAHREHCRHFPGTLAALRAIPDLVSAYVNVLEPHSRLPPHFGETNTIYRVHMGLVIPAGVDACGFEVEGERVGWNEGEVIVFNDARRHFVWNDSDRPRVILVCDVMKPQYGGASARACAKVLGAIVGMFLQSRLGALRRLPPAATRVLHEAASLPFHAYLALFGARPGRPARVRRAARPATG